MTMLCCRIWNMDTMMPANTLYRRNIYSEELLKTLYIDPGLGFIKEQDTSAAAGEKVFYLTVASCPAHLSCL